MTPFWGDSRRPKGCGPGGVPGPCGVFGLEFDLLRDRKRAIRFDPGIADCALQFGVTEQQLHGS